LDFLRQLGGITITTNKLVEKDANDARPPQLSVTGKLTHEKPIEVENYKYLESLIDTSKGEVVKIAIPSATMVSPGFTQNTTATCTLAHQVFCIGSLQRWKSQYRH
jgi:methionine synthase II (cobalamin-independent)